MTVLELKNLLKKCNDEDLVKIKVKKYSVNEGKTIDETYADPEIATYEVFLDNQDDDTFLLTVMLYEDLGGRD